MDPIHVALWAKHLTSYTVIFFLYSLFVSYCSECKKNNYLSIDIKSIQVSQYLYIFTMWLLLSFKFKQKSYFMVENANAERKSGATKKTAFNREEKCCVMHCITTENVEINPNHSIQFNLMFSIHILYTNV